jgi:NLI interacting factor-like phosphatase
MVYTMGGASAHELPRKGMTASNITVLALDLEGTLISNAVSCFPRPGLRPFLEFCHAHFRRVVIFTTVPEPRGRSILAALADEGMAPAWIREVEFVRWTGKVKDLRFIEGAETAGVLLVDDLEAYVHRDQRAQWILIEQFAAPYPESDRELMRVTEELRRRLQAPDQGSPVS